MSASKYYSANGVGYLAQSGGLGIHLRVKNSSEGAME